MRKLAYLPSNATKTPLDFGGRFLIVVVADFCFS